MKRIFATLVVVLFFPAWVIGAQQNAFIDPTTGILKTVGYTETNSPGDIKIPVPANFKLKPGDWKWNGTGWVANPPAADQTLLDLNDLAYSIDKAVASTNVPAEIKEVLLKLKTILGK
jgi:hypothetical protein